MTIVENVLVYVIMSVVFISIIGTVSERFS
jgi:hypothetical protein